VNNNPPEPAPGATTRERFAEHTTESGCAGCHSLIDPIGFGFEQYDTVGRYRTMDNGLPVDAAGELILDDDQSGPFNGAIELAHKLAESEEVRGCVARQWFRFTTGRLETADDDCSLVSFGEKFAASDYDIRALVLAIVSSDAFRYRRGAP
jgi:hypothetical protein